MVLGSGGEAVPAVLQVKHERTLSTVDADETAERDVTWEKSLRELYERATRDSGLRICIGTGERGGEGGQRLRKKEDDKKNLFAVPVCSGWHGRAKALR